MTYVLDLEENLSRSEEGHRRTPNGHAIVMMKLMLRIIILYNDSDFNTNNSHYKYL